MCCLRRMSQSYFISSEKHCLITSLTLLHVVQPVKVYHIDFITTALFVTTRPFHYNTLVAPQRCFFATARPLHRKPCFPMQRFLALSTTPTARDTLSFALHLFLFVTIFSVVLARPSRHTSIAPFT